MRRLPARTLLASAGLAAMIAALTLSPAGSQVRQRFSTVTTHNEADNAVVFLNLNTSGSGLSGQVGPAPYTSVATAGVFGVFAPSSTSAFGDGVVGLSSTGYGVVGEAVAGTFAAVYGQNFSLFGGPGVQGVSAGNGVVGQSTKTNGIVGQTSQPSGTTSAGVLGQDTANSDQFNDGVMGTTTNGAYGVEGTSSNDGVGGVHGLGTTGVGVRGDSTSNLGVLGVSSSEAGVEGISSSSFGVLGESTPSDGGHFISGSLSGAYGESNTGAGLFGQNDNTGTASGNAVDVGVFATSAAGDGLYATSTRFLGAFITNASTFDTMAVEATGSANPLFARASGGGTMTFDSGGNLTVSGTITGGAFATDRTRNPGTDLMTYQTQETELTVEDVGSAQLVRGTASVALASDFKQTIDGSSQYMVFLTPYGDTHGLYVSQRGPQGFVVRENGSGSSTVAFDYRIVARPYGAHTARLPHFASIVRPLQTNHDGGPVSRTEFARLTHAPALLPASRSNIKAKVLNRTFTPNHIPTAPAALRFTTR
jgi:hypothetical protein